jgi:serine/threonine-protein kinase HipA
MQLAKKIGINTANTHLRQVLGKDVLLVERFDRSLTHENLLTRHFMISALTALQLHEMEARYASYLNLADFIRQYSKNPLNDMHELYRRMVFNILIGNTDDHARNHAFFWDGKHYDLTPAYDICPTLRVGHIATQAMQVGTKGAKSTLKNALSSSERFGLTQVQAKIINDEIVTGIKNNWLQICDSALLAEQDRINLERATVLCDYCFEE